MDAVSLWWLFLCFLFLPETVSVRVWPAVADMSPPGFSPSIGRLCYLEKSLFILLKRSPLCWVSGISLVPVSCLRFHWGVTVEIKLTEDRSDEWATEAFFKLMRIDFLIPFSRFSKSCIYFFIAKHRMYVSMTASAPVDGKMSQRHFLGLYHVDMLVNSKNEFHGSS